MGMPAAADVTTTPPEKPAALRLAAIGDVHCAKASAGNLRLLFEEAASRADVLLLCGDLTNNGLPEEARLLAAELPVRKIPVLGVLGNHDCEAGKETEIEKILSDAGMVLLDGDSYEIQGVGFAGVKGFGGGFGSYGLQPWGERAIKDFVQESVKESIKLESALAKLRTESRVVLLHYSPIPATVVGEPVEIFPYLGTSRLEEPIDRYRVTAVFHGHAHHGSPEGRTRSGVPVYNVALPLMREIFPGVPPFRFLEVPKRAKSDPAVKPSTA